uniref:Transcriptional regulator n=1 Tax=Heterorhabditis bacteriophora TaxID=37862 RepID=A0A1I7W9E2_HETBA
MAEKYYYGIRYKEIGLVTNCEIYVYMICYVYYKLITLFLKKQAETSLQKARLNAYNN